MEIQIISEFQKQQITDQILNQSNVVIPIVKDLETPAKTQQDLLATSGRDSTPEVNSSSKKFVGKKISSYLGSYAANFKDDIDQIWNDNCDEGKEGLNKSQANKFINKISSSIDPSRAQFYDKDQFDVLFEEIDEDSNGSLSMNEMAIFIKKTFSSTNNSPQKKKPHNSVFKELN